MAAMSQSSNSGRLLFLELENFKSYAGVHRIGPFEDNFVSIIGPNGSGKSNLMDALSFVLGLSSQQLRSNSLIELVYRGPGANVNAVTSVSAHFETSQGRTKVFSRRINGNNGGTNYVIDGRTVSQQEYLDTWEQENVLIKARNFLVFQGDVDALATRSPKDLAQLVEQVSGSVEFVAEYDACRVRLDRALEDSALNFSRRRGLGAELKAVQEQRSDVRLFNELVDQRQTLRSDLALARLFAVESAARATADRIASSASTVSEAEASLASSSSSWKAAKKQLTATTKKGAAIEREHARAVQALDGQLPALLTQQTLSQRLESKMAAIRNNLDALHSDNAEEAQKTAELLAQQLQVELAEFEAQASERLSKAWQVDAEAVAEWQVLRSQVDALTASERLKMQTLSRQIAPTRATVSVLESKLEELALVEQRIVQDQKEVARQLSKVEDEENALVAELKSVEEQVARHAADRSKAEERVAEYTERLRSVVEQLLAHGAAAASNEREMKLRSAVELLKRHFPSTVYGRMVDVVRPISKRFETAVSASLGRHMDSVIVEDAQTALACIDLIKEQAVALHFLPLSNLKVSTTNEGLLMGQKAPPMSRWAMDVMRYDERFQIAVEHAVGGVLVCDSMDAARKLRSNCRRAISLDGSVFARSGLITGGSLTGNKASGSASRWEETDASRLMQERDDIVASIRECNTALRRNEVEEKKKLSIVQLKAQLSTLRDTVEYLSRRVSSFEDESQHVAREVERIRNQIEELESSIADREQQLKTLEDEITAKDLDTFSEFCRKWSVATVKEFETEMGAGRLAEQVHQQRIDFETRLARARSDASFAAIRVAENGNRVIDLEKELSLLTQQHVEVQAAISSLSVIVEELRIKKQAALDVLSKHRMNIQSLTSQVQTCRDEMTAAQALLAEIARSHTSDECELDRLLAQRVQMLRSCRVEQIDIPLLGGEEGFDSLLKLSLDSLTEEAGAVRVDFATLASRHRNASGLQMLEDKLAETERQMERIAPNLRSLDKIDGAEQHLKDTMVAFDQAKNQLKIAKEEFALVKNERKKRFQAALEHISNCIDRIYKALTSSDLVPTGGSAFVMAENAEEPYLEGVRFHAMPPMKRFLEHEQLSGGERTMAALALLFAIQSFRPAPFFIMDEVDAALDAANVQRIARFIRSMATGHNSSLGSTGNQSNVLNSSTKVQFLVISLKSSLYEHADALVGVHRDMQSHSSRVLSLKLSDHPY